MAKLSDVNSSALLVHWSSTIANTLKCKGFGMESKKCCSSRAYNQLFVLFTCENGERERTGQRKAEKLLPKNTGQDYFKEDSAELLSGQAVWNAGSENGDGRAAAAPSLFHSNNTNCRSWATSVCWGNPYSIPKVTKQYQHGNYWRTTDLLNTFKHFKEFALFSGYSATLVEIFFIFMSSQEQVWFSEKKAGFSLKKLQQN